MCRRCSPQKQNKRKEKAKQSKGIMNTEVMIMVPVAKALLMKWFLTEGISVQVFLNCYSLSCTYGFYILSYAVLERTQYLGNRHSVLLSSLPNKFNSLTAISHNKHVFHDFVFPSHSMNVFLLVSIILVYDNTYLQAVIHPRCKPVMFSGILNQIMVQIFFLFFFFCLFRAAPEAYGGFQG